MNDKWESVLRLAENNPIVRAALNNYPNSSRLDQCILMVLAMAEDRERLISKAISAVKNSIPIVLDTGGVPTSDEIVAAQQMTAETQLPLVFCTCGEDGQKPALPHKTHCPKADE